MLLRLRPRPNGFIEPCLPSPAPKPPGPAVRREAEEDWGRERWRWQVGRSDGKTQPRGSRAFFPGCREDAAVPWFP